MRLWREKRRILVGSFILFLVLAPLVTLVVGQLTRATGGQVGSGDCLTTVSETSTVSVSSSGGKCIYTFTNGSNSLTPPAGAKRIDFLVVGGGGGGGSNRAGGGGSGGFYEGSWTYTSGAVDVAVGAGGAGGAIPVSNVGSRGSNGGSSSITATGAQFAAGGGGGGGAHSVTGGNQMGIDGGAIQSGYTGPSGSGGGGSMNFGGSGFTGGTGYSGSSGFGNNGAASRNDAEPVRNTGGGGGAGGVGVAGSDGNCSATSGTTPQGGAGLSSSISGTAVLYAAGGGGADARGADEACGGSAPELKSSAGAGSGGSGIGGSGAAYSGSPTDAVQNRGSGGGGGSSGATAGGNGSAGIVVLSIDATKPESSGSTTTEYLGKSTNTVSVAYSATDTNGVSSVTTYYSTLANLSSPTSCGSATGLSGTSATGTITCTLPSNPSVISTFYMYTVATDASGLVEDAPTVADDSFTHDAITPLSTSTTSRSASNSTTVSIGYSATDAVGLSSVKVYYTSYSNLQSGTLCGSANVSGTTATGSINCVTGSLNNGWSYYYYTVATDLAGQVEATADFTPASVVKYDITVPIFGTRPFLGAIAGPGVGVTVSSSEVGTAYLLKMSSSVSTEADILALDGTLWNSVAVTAASTDVTIPAGGLVEGSYVVYLVDEAGNLSTPSEVVTIDNTAPNKPTVSLDYYSDAGVSQSDGLTNVVGPIFNSQSNENKGRMVFTAVNGASTVTCTANFVSYITNGSNSCGFSTLAAGVWTVTAVHIDGGGNTSPTSDAVTLTIDTTAPSAPTTTDLLAISDWGTSSTDNKTASRTPNFAVTALPETTGSVEIKAVIGGTTYTCSYTSASTDQFCALSLTSPNTTTTVQARFTDAAGNVSAWNTGLSVTFDTTVPTLSFPSALATGYGSADTWLGVNSEAGAIYLVADQLTSFLDIATFTSTQIKSATASPGANTLLFTTGLESDPSYYIYAMDTAGNLSVASSSFVIDTLAPTVVRVYGTDGAYKQGSIVNITVEFSEAVNVVTAGGTPNLITGAGTATYVSGSGTANLVFRVTVGASTNIADLNYNTTLSLSVSGGTIKDVYKNNATVTLPALNAPESLASQSNIRIDTTVPSPVYTLPTTPTNAGTLMFTVTYSEIVTGLSASNFTLGGTAGSSCTSKDLLTTDSIVYYLYAFGCGEGTLTVSQTANTATDGAGNLGPASTVTSSAVTIDRTAPTITACTCGKVSGAAGSAGTSTSLTSNSIGTGYLVKSSIAVYSLSDITSASDDQWNSVTIPIANSATTLNPLGLGEGLYYYYAVDAAGNLSAAYTTSSVTVDNTTPTVTYTSPAILGPTTGKPSATLTETGKVYAVLSTLTPPSPITTTWLASNGKFLITIAAANTSTAWTATIVTCCTFTAGTYNVYAQDDAGNITAPVMGAFTVDLSVPTVTGAYTSAANGTYLLGSVIPIYITFSETVYVGGTPSIILETGSTDRTVNYVSGAGTNTLRFDYTVQAGDTSSDLDFVTSGSVSAGVKDAAGNPDTQMAIAITKIGPSVSGSISNASDIVVDGSVPTVTGVSSANGNQSSYFTTLTFNLDVSDFDAADVTNIGTATGCTVSVSATSAKVYVASFANCSDGTIIPRVRVDAATLANGITGPKSAYSSGTITKDTTAPVVTPGGVTTFSPSKTTTFTVNGAATVYLVSTSVQVTDVNSITSAASNQRATFTYTSGTTTVTGSGLLDGDYKYYAVDSYGNLSAASTGTFTLDTVAPTITLTPASLIIGGSASMSSNEVASLYLVRQTVTVTSYNSITGAASLNAKGVYATNKSASLAVSGLASDRFYAYAIDNANNVSAQSVDYVTIDNTAPAITSVTASADGTYIIGQTVLIDIVFDDTVTVNTTNGTPTLLLETGTTDRNASYVSGSGTTTLRFSYTVQDGDLSTDLSYVSTSSLSANGGTMTDASGNTATLTLPTIGFPASLQARSAVVVRGQRITASAIYSPATNPTNAASVSYAFSFSSAPTGLESSDFTFGGTATGCIATVSGAVTSSASVIVSGCSDGTVILKLPAGSMSDSYGNTAPGSDYSASSLTFDRTGPVPTFTAPSTPTSLATLAYTVAFNETMSGLIASDFQVTGTATGCVVGTPSASSGTSVTVSLTSCSAGTVILTLKAGMVNDSLSNTGPATAVSATTVTRDVTVPSVSSFTPNATPTNASSPTFTLTFSEAITGLTSADFSNTGTANGCLFSPDASSGTVFTVTVNSCAQGTVIPRIPALAVADLASNSGPTLAFIGGTLTIDRTAPSAPNAPAMATASDTGLSSSDAKTKNSSVTATVSTPEATGSVAVSAVLGGTTVTCSGAVASSSGSCELVGLTDGSWTLSATFTDAAGNVSVSSSTSTFVIDTTASTVTITAPSPLVNALPVTYTLTFSESINGLISSDFSNSSGTATNCVFTPSASTGTSITVSVSSCTDGTVNLTLAANGVNDVSGNSGPASDAVASTVRVDRVATAPTLTSIRAKSSASATVSATETGTVYLVKSTVTVSTVSSITGANSNLWTSVAITSANISTSLPLSGLVDGSYRAFLFDDAGNLSTNSSSLVTVDDTAPTPSMSAQSVRSAAGATVRSSEIGVAYLVKASATVTTLADITGLADAEWNQVSVTAAASDTVLSATGLAEGDYVLYVIDEAGNLSGASSAAVTVDNTAPTINSFTAPSSPVNSLPVTYTLTFNGPVTGLTSFDFSNGSGTATGCTFTPSSSSGTTITVSVDMCSDGTLDLTLATNGVSDAAGNTAPSADEVAAMVTIDNGPPVASLTSGRVKSSTSANVQSNKVGTVYLVKSTVTVNALADITGADGALWNSVPISVINTNTSLALTGLVEGSYRAYAADNRGTMSVASSGSVVVDDTAPTPSMSARSVRSAASATVRSSEIGVAYLVKASATVTTLADITGLADAEWNQVSVTAAASDTVLSATGLAEGDYVLYVIDEAGNLSGASSAAVTVDNTAPTVVTFTGPVSPTRVMSLTFTLGFDGSVSGLTGSDFSNTGTATNCVFTPSASSGSVFTITLSSCDEGTVVLTLGAGAVSDAAGNTAPGLAEAAVSVTIDRVATAPTLTSVRAKSSASATVSAAETGTVYLVKSTVAVNALVDIIGADGTSWNSVSIVNANTSTGLPLSGLVDGSYRAFLFDDAGNLSTNSSLSVTVDDTAPGVPESVGVALLSDLGSSSSDGVTSDVTPSVRVVAAEAGGTVTVTASKLGESDVVCTMSGSTSGGSCDLGVLADGVWVLTASQADVAGNVGSSVSGSVVVDTVAPLVSGVSSSTADGAKKSGVVIGIRVAFDGVVVVDTTSGSPSLTLETGATDRDAVFVSGSSSSVLVFNYTVQAGDTSADLEYTSTSALSLNGGIITDVAGNTAVLTLPTPAAANSLSSNQNIVIDTTAPNAPTAVAVSAASDSGLSSSDGITNDSTPTISVSASENGGTVTVTASQSGQSDKTCITTGSTTGSTCDLSALIDGTWSVAVSQNDAAGNISGTTSISMVIDTTNPTPSLSAQTVMSSANATVRSNEIGAAYVVKSTVTVATIADITGAVDALWNSSSIAAADTDITMSMAGLGEGAYKLYVVDRAGNLSTGTLATVTIDNTAPVAPTSVQVATASDLGSSNSDGITSDSTPTIKVIAAENGGTVTVTASKSGSSNVSCSVSGSTTGSTCDLTTLIDGTWTLSASQSDVAGNASSSVSGSVTIDTEAPTVSGVSSTTADGSKKAGVAVDVRVSFDSLVNLNISGGSPTVVLETGTTDRSATYVSGSASSTLVFSYTVQAGDTSTDLDYVATSSLSLNGSTIFDVAGNNAVVTLAAPGAAGSLGAAQAIVIDTTVPGIPTASVATGSDSGSSTSDGITSDTTPTINVISAEDGGMVTATASKSGQSDVVCSMSGSTSGSTCDLGALVEGTWTVSVEQSDAATNVGTATSFTIVIDTTAPLPTMSTQSLKSSASVTVRSNEIGSAYLVKSTVLVSVLVDITGSADADWNQIAVVTAATDTTLAATGLGEGDYSLYVVDRAGNLSAGSLTTVTIDNTAPGILSLTSPTSPNRLTTLSYTLTFDGAVSGLTAADFSNSGTATSCAFASSASAGTTFTITVTSCSEGTLVVDVRANAVADAAGNNSPASTYSASTITIDRTVVAPTLTSASLKSSDNATVSAAETGTVYVVKSSVTVSALADITSADGTLWNSVSVTAASSPTSVSLSGLVEGTYRAFLLDDAGNLSTNSSSSVTVDNTAPVIVSLTAPSSPTNSNSLSYTLTFDGAVSGLTAADFSNTGTATGCVFSPATSSGTTFTVTVTSCSEGTIVVEVRSGAVVDAAGNSAPSAANSASSVTVDRSAPNAPILANAVLLPSGNATVQGDELSVVYLVNSSVVVTDLASITSSSGSLWNQLTLVAINTDTPIAATGLIDGTYRAYSVDAAGNVSNASSNSVTIDSAPPALTISASPSSVVAGGTSTITFTWSEVVSGFTASDITAGLGILSNFSGSGTTYTATFTASTVTGGTANISVAAGSVTDVGNNVNAVATGSVTVASPAGSNNRQSVYVGSSNYIIEQFTTAGTYSWRAPANVTSVESLVVGAGGGGGGGGYVSGGNGGGGGAGAGGSVKLATSSVVPGNLYGVTVGEGGAGGLGGKPSMTFQTQGTGGIGGSGSQGIVTTADGGYGGCASALNASNLDCGYLLITHGYGGFGAASPNLNRVGGNRASINGGGGGGGAGSASSGGSTSTSAGGAAGAGTPTNFYGVTDNFGVGGIGGAGAAGTISGASGTSRGNGGGGGSGGLNGSHGGNGGRGSDGLVVIRYAAPSISALDLDATDDSGTSNTDNLTNVTTPTFTGTAPVGATVQLYVDGVASGATCTADSVTGIFACDTGAMTDGSHSITAKSSVLLAGGLVESTSAAFTVTLDLVAPTPVLTTATVNWGETATTQSNELGTVYLVKDTVVVANVATITAANTNVWNSVAITAVNTNTTMSSSGLISGDYKLYAVDNAGNLSTASVGIVTYVDDLTAPTITLTSARLRSTQSAVVESTEIGTAYLVKSTVAVSSLSSIVNAAANSRASVLITAANSSTNIPVAGLLEGTYSAYAVDRAGNFSVVSLNSVEVDLTAPSVSSLTSGASAYTARTFEFTLTMSESITGLTSVDFSSTGTASSCTFTPSSSSGTTFTVSVTCSSDGTVIPRLAANSIADLAGLTGPTSTYFGSSINLGATPTQLVLSTSSVGTASGAAFTTQPAITMKNAQNLVVTGVTGTVTATITQVNGTGVLVGASTASFDVATGIATFTDLGISGTAGTRYTITFTSGSLTAATQNITVTVGAATSLAMSTQPVGGASGAQLATQPVVKVVDSGGNTVTSATASVGVSSTSGTLGGTRPRVTSNGVATFTDLTFSGLASQSHTLTFAATGLTSVTSSSFNITAGTATQLVLVTQSVGTESGVIFTTQPVLEVRDSGGNKVTTGLAATVNVTATVSSGAVLDGTRAVNAVAGVATYSNLGISGTAGTSYTMTYSATGLTSAVQLVTPTVGPATKLVIDTQPVGAGAGAALATQPIINVTDSGGNVITGSNATIVVSAASGNLSGTTSINATAGVVAYTDLVFAGTAGTNYRLSFSSFGLQPVDSATFTVSIGDPTRLQITRQPVGSRAGAILATQPIIKVLDAGDNVVTSSTDTIDVTASGGTLDGSVSKNAVAGVVTFSDLTFAGTINTDYTLTFEVSGLPTVTSNSIRVTVGDPAQLTVTTVGDHARYGRAFGTQPVVEIQDAGGNRTTSTLTVTATLNGGVVVGTNGQTKTATAVAGIATFSGLGITGTPGRYDIDFEVAGRNDIYSTSQSIVVDLADQTINFTDPVDRDYNTATFNLSASSSSNLPVSFVSTTTSICTVNGFTVTMRAVGTCSITASQSGDSNHYPAADVVQDFVISRATPRVGLAAIANKTYGTTFYAVATADVPLLMDFTGTTGVCMVGTPTLTNNDSRAQVSMVGTGTCIITVSRPQDALYNAAVASSLSSVSRQFTVVPATGTITFDQTTLAQTYDGTPRTASATTNSGTLTITYTGIAPTIYAPSTTPPVNAGSYAVVAVMNDANYEAIVPETLVVAKASGAIALDNNSLTQMYSGTSRSAVVSSTTPTGLASIITYSGTQGTVYGPSLFAPTNSGTYNVIATLNDINYRAQTSGTLTVAPGTQSMISFITRSATTFDVPFNLLAVGGTGSGAMTYAVDNTVYPPSPCIVDANSGLLTPTGTGDCVVIATRGSSGNFAATSSLPFTVTITPAAQTVWFTSQVPSTPLPEATYEPTATASSGLAADISITVGDQTVCTFDSSTGVLTFVASGTCTITANQVGDGNWAAATSVTQSMTVGRLNQTITFAPVATKSYGDPIFALGATSSSGQPVTYAVVSGSSTCSVAPGGVVTLGVIGTCTISANQPGDSVYLPADEVSRTFTVIPTVPSAPFLSSVSTNDGSVTVAYSAPSTDGGAPIQAYTVTVRRAGEDRSHDVVRTDCTSSMSCYIDGLTNGDSYVVTVAASNIVGVGAASAESPLILPVLNPQAVRSLTARAGDSVIDVAWVAPANLGGGVFERYEISIRSRDGVYSTPISITDPNALSYQFTGLDNGTGYDVKVVTITSGNSDSGQVEFTGNTAEVYEMPRTVPSPPREVTIAAPTGRVARVSWRVPLSDGGAVITSYSTNVPNSVCSMASPVDVVCEISGLTPGSPLAIEVRAVNSVGESLPMSAAINLPNRPLPPSMRSVVVDVASATVEWSAPTSDGGQPIIGYFVYAIETGVRSISEANQLTVADVSVSSLVPLCSTAATSCQVEGLDPAKKYKFLVTAVNAVGESDGSEPWDPFGPDVTPTTPVDSSVPPTTSNTSTPSTTSNTGTLPRTGRGGRDSLGVVAWWIFIAGLGVAATLGRRRSHR